MEGTVKSHAAPGLTQHMKGGKSAAVVGRGRASRAAAGLSVSRHACLLAAQNSAAFSNESPGEMPFCTSSSFPPLPTTTWLQASSGEEQQAAGGGG